MASEPFLFNHVSRSYAFGALIGQRMDMTYDPELFYIAAMLHDLGLTETYKGDDRFEVDAADAAARFLAAQNVERSRIDRVWDAIALHTTFSIPQKKSPEAALVQIGAGIDVGVIPHDEITPEVMEQVLDAYPRLGFKKAMEQALTRIYAEKPMTAMHNFGADVARRNVPSFRQPHFCDMLHGADFPE
ncbi:HD domain-containing protein [Leisingera sp. SS27]|uniref:HD domain-containing protein n=1 Tax=Leisingera sp. SS27 TaxID=2979462 RepID=UPI002330C412|nr:HD domain-containing protein [Leisingera sp. SS27]MDC0658533.1 HD domain-containing protein [Leisingera sp. SS27]